MHSERLLASLHSERLRALDNLLKLNGLIRSMHTDAFGMCSIYKRGSKHTGYVSTNETYESWLSAVEMYMWWERHGS